MGRLVLYVDDEAVLCRAFARSLRASDFRVVTTTSAATAVELMRNMRFDVVASDLRMPEMTGLDVLRHARETLPAAQRLLVSGQFDRVVNEDDLVDAGVDKVLEKPWTFDELRDALGVS